MKARRAFLLLMTLVLVVSGAGWLWVRQAQRQYTLNRQLIAALVHNDTKQALTLVNKGADPNTRCNPTPAPSLPELLQQFLHHQPPPDNDSPTAFLLACSVNWICSNDDTSASVSVQEDLPLVRAMLEHGADVNATTSDRDTALISAVHNRDAATVALLLEHGAKVNAPDIDGRTALMDAVFNYKSKHVAVLLTHGADVNVQDRFGVTVLTYAIDAGTAKDLILQLLAHGADPNLPSKQGVTPLMYAQVMKRPDLVALLKRGGK